ncbi:MAG: chemotaxis protein CheW [Alphaproteobacteria bacterium]
MNQLATVSSRQNVVEDKKPKQVFVTFYVDKQLFGISVEKVQDILVSENIAHIPLSSEKVAGNINLRGRIVTVIDFRRCLGLPDHDNGEQHLATVEIGEELYSIKVDNVGTVMEIKTSDIENNPSTMDKKWQSVSSGVVKLSKEIMIILDANALINSKN